MRTAPNSHGRGPKHPGACHSSGNPAWVVRLLPRCFKQPGEGPRTPRGLWAHPLLGVCAPHVAPRARLTLFPPLPCPWAAIRSSGAAGLPWLLAPAGKCGRPALSSPLRPLLHCPEGHKCSAIVLCCRFQLSACWAVLLAAACGQQPTDAGGLLALTACLLGHRLLSAPHLTALVPPRCFVPVSELPALQPVIVRTPGPSVMPQLFHAGWPNASC